MMFQKNSWALIRKSVCAPWVSQRLWSILCWVAVLQLQLFAGSCSTSPVQLSSESSSPRERATSSKPVALAEQIQATESANDESEQQQAPKVRTFDEMLLFQPAKYPKGNWKPGFLDFQDHFFDSSDGTRIHAWYCPVEDPIAVILYLHGNAGNLSGRARLMKLLQEEHQVSVMIVDYRGYGRSEGKTTAQGAIQDAQAARRKLAELADIDENEVVLMGRSLGGAIAIQLAAEMSPRGLIIESSFSSLKEIAKHHFPKLAWLVPFDKLHSESTIKKNQAPTLISHGNRDRVIPYEMGKKLFAVANEPKEFVTIPDANHNDQQTSEYYLVFNRFLKQLVK